MIEASPPETRRQYLTRKKREQRAAARAGGRCAVCAKNPVTNKVTCDACLAAIVAWQRANGWP
jgi:hypothetical protein